MKKVLLASSLCAVTLLTVACGSSGDKKKILVMRLNRY